jgi:homoserine kinase type II
MGASSLDDAAQEVLAAYPLGGPLAVEFLGNAGGFSGARLWRIRTLNESWCLRAWPPDGIDADRLSHIHRWMSAPRRAGLTFVPRVMRTTGQATWQRHGGRYWDLTDWMPGAADFCSAPSTARIEAACTALADLHRVWNGLEIEFGVPKSVVRRLKAIEDWKSIVRSVWRPQIDRHHSDPLDAIAENAWSVVLRWLPESEFALAPWAHREFRLHPCLCDIWHDHVLFDGDRVAGIIDYGAMRLDHPAADLARLLGCLAANDETLYQAGLAAYRRSAFFSADEENLTRILDRTGAVLAIGNWLLWLYRDRRSFADQSAVAGRVARLVTRVDAWSRSHCIWRE